VDLAEMKTQVAGKRKLDSEQAVAILEYLPPDKE
jgi:hypothetical protein